MSEKQNLKGITGFEEQQTVGVSPWMLALLGELGPERRAPHWSYLQDEFAFELVQGQQSLWLLTQFPSEGRIAFRLAYCPDGEVGIDEIEQMGTGIEIRAHSTVGSFRVQLEFIQGGRPLLHYRTFLRPIAPLSIPFWPRDVIPLGDDDDPINSEGIIYTSQVKVRSGLLYLSLTRPNEGTLLYFQNLTSLNDYCKQTETSLAGVVGGQWPELGLALPAAPEKAFASGQEVTLSDAYVIVTPKVPRDDLEMSKQFLDLLAQVYLALPRVETEYVHWPEVGKKTLHDLTHSDKCWSEQKGQYYLSAYVGDSETPPESMVQLTLLLPLLEYSDWSQQEIPITNDILSGLPGFFDRKAGVLGRWLISAADKLDASEPQKKPRVMDSWYLYHSLLNLSRLAMLGDEKARKLFLDSLEYAIRVAHEFKYHWPVFYDLDTLEVLKAETKEGEGGETDVPGMYAHVMMQAWKLTQDTRYLEEAKQAARSLKGLGFHMFYQANEVLFASGALLRLWKETGDEEFLDLSYLCLANIFNNVWLWECEYGYAEHYKTFFALFPLKDAPYTSVYEELEGLAALHDYLEHFDGETPESLNILIAEFIRCMVYKASFYYPPSLPKEVMAEKPKTGEIDPKLWIPLEDMYDGWEQAGQVGQEVYGAGLPFTIIPRHYWQVPDEKFMMYLDYPTQNFSVEKGQASIDVLGDPRLSCRLRLMPTGKKALPNCRVQTESDGETELLHGTKTAEGHLEYQVFGHRKVTVIWEADDEKSNGRKGSKK